MEKSWTDIVWVITASSLVFIMQAGFALVESGLTRGKNSINVAVKNLTDFGVSVLCFWILGYALMFGDSAFGIVGLGPPFHEPPGVWPVVFFLFQMMFCSTSATIVSGAVAERMRYGSYIVSTVLLSLIIYPVFGHWTWGGGLEGTPSGWLGKLGFVDFAGSTVVHSLGGWVSLAALVILGPRAGRFGTDGRVAVINGSNIPMVVLGVFILWFGWFGFNGGSTLSADGAVAPIILNTTLAGAAGMVGTLALGWPLMKRPDVGLVLNGSLAGLVAVTASCHAVTGFESVLIGAVGGIVMLGTSRLLEKLGIDDAVGAIPVHLGSGIWGTLCVGLFGDPETLGTGLSVWNQVIVQLSGILACGAWSFGTAFVLLFILNRFSPLRVTPEAENTGLNKAEHGVTTEIYDLFSVLEEQKRTGNMKLRAPVEPFTEVGQIADMYNAVLDTLSDRTVEKDEYLTILRHASDGMFLLDRDFAIGRYYSASLEDILHAGQLAGKTLPEVLSPVLDEKGRLGLGEYLEVCFDPAVSWRNAERLNPLADIHLAFDDMHGGFLERDLSFRFKRIEKNGTVERLLVLVQDMTRQKELSDEVERTRDRSRQEMEMLHRVLHIEPVLLRDFLESVDQDLEAINRVFRHGEGNLRSRLETVFRHSHAVKGDSELLKLEFLSEKAEELEKRIAGLLKSGDPEPEDFLSLTIGYSELRARVSDLQDLLGRWTDLGNAFSEGGSVEPPGFLFSSLSNLTGRMAEQYRKKITFSSAGLDTSALPQKFRKTVKDILVQLVRNAVFHGIEPPGERLDLGKAETGSIFVEAVVRNGKLRLRVRDDGHGIDTEKVKKRAEERGVKPKYGDVFTDRELCTLIFHPGLSTADSSDKSAGKGIGMSLVRSLVSERGGKIRIRTKKHSGCEFIIEMPYDTAGVT